tara:strand:- start:145 stop:501 length:357 start_codon:yes stop_codon:yes gene_type:complete
MKYIFKDLEFQAFIPLTDKYGISVVIMGEHYTLRYNKQLYEIGVMRFNKETKEYELEQDGPNYYDVIPYLDEDEVTIVMEMIQNGNYDYYYSKVHKQRYEAYNGIKVENKTLTKHKKS